jgi:uncharacterized protein (UPF0276 family)
MIARDERSAVTPAHVGVGLRAPHVAEVMATRPAIAFLEVHTENYLGGGPTVAGLERLRHDYAMSLHGVGLSLGGADPLDRRHLMRVKSLVDRIQPALVSEHLAWSVGGGAYLNHLLPLPYDESRLEATSRRIEQVQETLGRAILVENPARYLRFRHSAISEPEFLIELARRTGCGILLDVNNVYVSSYNFDEDASSRSRSSRRRSPGRSRRCSWACSSRGASPVRSARSPEGWRASPAAISTRSSRFARATRSAS